MAMREIHISQELLKIRKDCILDPALLGIKAKLRIEKNRSRWRNYTYIENELHQMWTHRFVWREKHGIIPKGLYVAHRCGVSMCVNVDHLYLATHTQNMSDKYLQGTGFNKINGMEELKIILEKYNSGKYTQKQIALEHGITRKSVCGLLKKHNKANKSLIDL